MRRGCAPGPKEGIWPSLFHFISAAAPKGQPKVAEAPSRVTVPNSAAATFLNTFLRSSKIKRKVQRFPTYTLPPPPCSASPVTSIANERRTSVNTSQSPRVHGPHSGSLWALRFLWVWAIHSFQQRISPPKISPTTTLSHQNNLTNRKVQLSSEHPFGKVFSSENKE